MRVLLLAMLASAGYAEADLRYTLRPGDAPGTLSVTLDRKPDGPLRTLSPSFADRPYRYHLEKVLESSYSVRVEPSVDPMVLDMRQVLRVPASFQGPAVICFETTAPIAVPWPPAEHARLFRVQSLRELTDALVMIGPHSARELQVDRTVFRLAFSGRLDRSTETSLARALEAVTAEHARLFGGSPEGTLTVLIDRRADHREDAAGIIGGSAGLFLGQRSIEKGDFRLWMTPAHELFHLWNGGVIRPADRARWAWFTEGLTDYYVILALSRTGAMGLAPMLHELERAAEKYLTRAGDLSLEEGGLEGARAFVYGGGALAALDLDLSLRMAGSSLDEGLRELYAWCQVHGPFTALDFEAVFEKRLGAVHRGWLDRTVRGREAFDVEHLLRFAGLDVAVESSSDPRWPRNVTVKEPVDPRPAPGGARPPYLELRESAPGAAPGGPPLQDPAGR